MKDRILKRITELEEMRVEAQMQLFGINAALGELRALLEEPKEVENEEIIDVDSTAGDTTGDS